jgi:hypothetical protein
MKLTIHLNLLPRSKNEWSYTSTTQYVFIAWGLVQHRAEFGRRHEVGKVTSLKVCMVFRIFDSLISYETDF